MKYIVPLLLLCASTLHAETLTGKVVRVADGDTLTVLDAEKVQHRVRLEGIDAPEAKQAFGSRARQALADKVFEKEVRVEWTEKDRYKRILGHVYLGDRWINHALVAEGWAWHYTFYNDDDRLADAHTEAREKKLGLWADDEPIAPWDFRKSAKQSAK